MSENNPCADGREGRCAECDLAALDSLSFPMGFACHARDVLPHYIRRTMELESERETVVTGSMEAINAVANELVKVTGERDVLVYGLGVVVNHLACYVGEYGHARPDEIRSDLDQACKLLGWPVQCDKRAVRPPVDVEAQLAAAVGVARGAEGEVAG